MIRNRSFLALALFALLAAVLAAVVLPARADYDTQTFVVSFDNIASFPNSAYGVFNTPAGASGPGPALPGSAYSWTFDADAADSVSFATMFVQSNDWFFAPDENGIPLAQTGDVTAYVKLWDAGTEGDETPGEGANQAPRQTGPDTGPVDPNTHVRQVLSAALPAVDELIQVTLTSAGTNRYTLTIRNISGASSLPTPLAPGVGVVHSAPAPLFINGRSASAGLEALAEDGDAAGLAAEVAAHTGITTPLAPVAWTVHQSPNALFTAGQVASPGLQVLAEDGSPALLVEELDETRKGAAAVPTGAGVPGPIFPGGNYTFTIEAAPGDHLSTAMMFVQSNDWFFSLNNLPLFDADGAPISGSVSHLVRLYDAGSEVDQAPGLGSNQAPRQVGPNTGPSQGGVISPLMFGNNADYVHVTITPVN